MFQVALGAPATQVSRAVQAGARFGTEGVWDETVGGQLRAFEEAGGPLAADADFAFSPMGQGRICSSRIQTWVLSIGRPMVIFCFASTMRESVDHTVVSVGPYMFQSSTPCASNCSARDGGKGSPPHSALKPCGGSPAGFQQQVPGGGRRLHEGDAVMGDHLRQGFSVHGVFTLGQHHPRAADQWQHQFQHGNVKRQGGHGQQSVVSRDAGLALHAGQEVAHRSLGQHDPLGLPVEPDVDDVGSGVGAVGRSGCGSLVAAC